MSQNTPFQLRKAARTKAKIRLGLSAVSGGGKTYSAILIAKGLASGDLSKVAVIDTENGSADLYQHLGDYNVLSLDAPYSPERYIQAIKACEHAGMDVIIIDSISHEWDGAGGCLEINEKLGGRFQDWAKVTPRHRAFIDTILQSPCHVITTVRRKQDYEMSKDQQGRAKVEKAGLKETTREGFEYELTINLQLDQRHNATASKDRTGLFADKPEFVPSVATGEMIRDWCELGIVKNVAPALEHSGLEVNGNEITLSEDQKASEEDEAGNFQKQLQAVFEHIIEADSIEAAFARYDKADEVIRKNDLFNQKIEEHMNFQCPDQWKAHKEKSKQPTKKAPAKADQKTAADPMKKKYETPSDLEKALGKAISVTNLADLYYNNIDLIEKNAALKALFTARKLQVTNGTAVPETVAA